MCSKTLLALLAASLLFASPSSAHHSVLIQGNRGGEIGHFDHQFSYYRHDRARVRIAGDCLSACTMFLGLPDVCVYPSARIGFHMAVDAFGNLSPMGTQEMTRHYPGYLHVQLAYPPGLNYYSGAQLIAMGARPCV